MDEIVKDLGDTRSGWQSIVWRSIEFPGHEACRLYSIGPEWHLDGTAVLIHESKHCHLNYQITCDDNWRTISASIKGWAASELVNIQLDVDSRQAWKLNGVAVPEVAGSIDLDLNFSPSTNTIAIRRLKLAVGEEKEITAAWLRFPGFKLEPLSQRYHRLENHLYRYESGGGRFTADLHVDPSGFVVNYPGIWKVETGVDG